MKAKKDTFKLQLEVNKKYIDGDENNVLLFGKIPAMITPPLDEDYWQFRVKVDKDQAIVGFPKFGSIGVGFAKEDNWNTNLPSSYSTEIIWEHIKENKRYASIPDERCKKAIKMIQKAAKEFQQAELDAENLIILANEPKLKDEKTGKALSLKEFISRCNISKARRMETFINNFTKSETKKRLYCLLFGYDSNTGRYKYRMSGYFFNGKHATQTFYATIRRFNLNGSPDTGDRWISMKVAESADKGFKIPIVLPQPIEY